MIGSEPRQLLGHYVETLVAARPCAPFGSQHIGMGRVLGVAASSDKSDWPGADGQGYVSSGENQKSCAQATGIEIHCI